MERLGVEDFLVRREVVKWVCWVIIGKGLPEELLANIMIYCGEGAEGWLSHLRAYSVILGCW